MQIPLSLFKQLLPLSILFLLTQVAGAQHQGKSHPGSGIPDKNAFLAIMDSMMVKMEVASTNGSPEVAFIRQMIPHHEGAIAMAIYEIKHGQNFSMVQLAKSILAEQTLELQKMQGWLKQAKNKEGKNPAEFINSLNQTMGIMMKNIPAAAMLGDTDQAFARIMIPHHQAAVDMAKVVLRYATEKQVQAFAKQIISAQQVEIEQMRSF